MEDSSSKPRVVASPETVIQPHQKGFQFIVQGPTDKQIYLLNANSPFYNLDPCTPDKAKDPYFELFNSEYIYRELKPLVISCQKLVTAGKPIRSFWVSDKTGLVFKCD